MLNPEIEVEYGKKGADILEGLCNALTENERDSIYALDHNIVSIVSGVPSFINTNSSLLINGIREKVMDYFFSIDGDTIVLCDKYDGEGIKIWLTTQ